jgi:serine/threonine protein kinase
MSKVFTIMEGLENMGALRTGGQGSVYKGKRLGPILSAVKLLPTPIYTESADDKNYRTFMNEVEKLKKVNEVPNPNVVKILSSGITESGSLPFIEMEFIEGPDLGELLAEPHEKIFTIKETIKLADQLAGALAHCHKVGVKHGDVKSNNVKFNIHSGNYVLLDFGLSVMSDEERRSSMRHAGAIEFMAPEQNEGQMLFQTDVYSYGVILFELLAGRVPFPLHDNGETARNTVMVAHMESAVPDLMALRKENLPANWPKDKQEHEMQVPAWLLNLIYRCLEKKPDARYANGVEVQEAIMHGSVNVSGLQTADNSIYVLKAENEQLQNQLLQHREVAAIAQRSSVVVPKTSFRALVALAVLAVVFCIYLFFNPKKEVIYQPGQNAKSVYVPFVLMPNPNTHLATVAAKHASDSITKARQKAKLVIPPKKKRKKFLGIF